MPQAPRNGLVALWLLLSLIAGAIAIGLAEAAALGVRRAWTGELIWVGSSVVWMAPLGYALLAAGPAAVLAGIVRLWPKQERVMLALGLAGLSFAGSVPLLRVISAQRLHIAAMALVGAGLAIQVGRATWLSPGWSYRLGRRGFPLLVAVVGILALGVELAERVREASARRFTERAGASAEIPNVLLILLDTVRAIELGLYRPGFPTSPIIDSLAAHAVVFQNAFATSSWTLPSHASIFTGRFPHEFRADWRTPLGRTSMTVAEVFQQHGVRTGGFVGNLYYTTAETGLARGFERYEDFPVSVKEILYSTEFVQLVSRPRARVILRRHAPKRTDRIVQDFLQWQAGLGDRPFFGFINLFDAHIPRYAPDSIARRFAGLTGRVDEDRYAAAIAHMDRGIGRLLAELRRRGVLDRTVVVITSDHGEQFGTKGLFDHANSLYASTVQVPLLILLPDGRGGGLRIRQPVSLRNLPRTLLDLAGLGHAGPIPGTSLTRLWHADDPASLSQDMTVLSVLTPSPRVPKNHRNARGEVRSLVRGQWHYIVNGDGSTELYDYWADPLEERNLAGVPEGAAGALSMMRNKLVQFDRQFPRESAPAP